MSTPPLHLLRAFLPTLPDDVWADFAPIWQPFEAKRKALLTAEDQVERHLYFVLEGVQRAYAVAADGREATLVFMYPPSFAGVADSFLLQQPSRYCFETLTPSRFLRTTFRELDEVMLRHHALERAIRELVGHALAGALEAFCFVVNHEVGTEAFYQINVGSTRGGRHKSPQMFGQLNGKRTYTTRTSLNKYFLPFF